MKAIKLYEALTGASFSDACNALGSAFAVPEKDYRPSGGGTPPSPQPPPPPPPPKEEPNIYNDALLSSFVRFCKEKEDDAQAQKAKAYACEALCCSQVPEWVYSPVDWHLCYVPARKEVEQWVALQTETDKEAAQNLAVLASGHPLAIIWRTKLGIVAIQGRRIDGGTPKYRTPKGMRLSNRLFVAKSPKKIQGCRLYVCEGAMDAIALLMYWRYIRLEYDYCVIGLYSAAGELPTFFGKLAREAESVSLYIDNDTAGRSCRQKICVSLPLSVRVVECNLPDSKDVRDCLSYWLEASKPKEAKKVVPPLPSPDAGVARTQEEEKAPF